jgi:hypothetical protein
MHKWNPETSKVQIICEAMEGGKRKVGGGSLCSSDTRSLVANMAST